MPPPSRMGPSSSGRDNNTVGLFDWLKRTPPAPITWQVAMDGSDVVANNGTAEFRLARARARAVRVVPLTGGTPHAPEGGYQVAIDCGDGDFAVGKPAADWRAAHALALQICT